MAQVEEPGISGRDLGIGGQGINRRGWNTTIGSAGRGMVSRKAPIGQV